MGTKQEAVADVLNLTQHLTLPERVQALLDALEPYFLAESQVAWERGVQDTRRKEQLADRALEVGLPILLATFSAVVVMIVIALGRSPSMCTAIGM